MNFVEFDLVSVSEIQKVDTGSFSFSYVEDFQVDTFVSMKSKLSMLYKLQRF